MNAGLLNRLGEILGEAGLLTTPDAMAPYLHEWRGRFGSCALAVARPAHTGEVAAVVGACAASGVGVVPQGGNTGLVGGAVARADQIIVSLDRMTAIRALDAENDTVTVEAGAILADVQAAAAAVDRLFPLSLAAEGSARIGGNLATNAGGLNVLRYGNARDLTLGLEVVLADGRVWQDLRGLRKDNGGYDLKQWFIGSEGTLGIITAATLRLFPALRQRETALLGLAEPANALTLLRELRRASGEQVVACELMPAFALELVCRHMPDCHNPVDCAAPWYLLLELAGPSDHGALRPVLEACLAQARDDGRLLDSVIAANPEQSCALWRLRESIPAAQTREGASIKHDVSVPVSAIPALLERATAAVVAVVPGVRVCAFGHVGDGNLHFNLSQPVGADGEAFLARAPQCNRIVHDLVAGMGGSIAAEHGIGRLKPAELARYRPGIDLELMRRVKQALDPSGVLNPGVLFGATTASN